MLEASQNQQVWFTILEGYRILSIWQESVEFEFAKLLLPATKYRFFRLLIKAEKNPNLALARLLKNKEKKGDYRNYLVQKQSHQAFV